MLAEGLGKRVKYIIAEYAQCVCMRIEYSTFVILGVRLITEKYRLY